MLKFYSVTKLIKKLLGFSYDSDKTSFDDEIITFDKI